MYLETAAAAMHMAGIVTRKRRGENQLFTCGMAANSDLFIDTSQIAREGGRTNCSILVT